MPDMPTGQLIRLYRIERKKNTTSLATHAGITVRYLEMIEAGSKTPSIPVLRKLAQVLGVRTSALMGEAPSEDHEGQINPRLAKIERALFTYDSMPLESGDGGPEDLAARIEAASDAWFTAQESYTEVLSILPGLIVETERLVRESGYSSESCSLAYNLYKLARGVLKHAGRVDLCSMLAGELLREAEDLEKIVRRSQQGDGWDEKQAADIRAAISDADSVGRSVSYATQEIEMLRRDLQQAFGV